jgi:hypothetical protein
MGPSQVSKATNTFDIEISVTGIDDVRHSLRSGIAAELLADTASRVDMVSYLVNRSKGVIIDKIKESSK